MRAHLIQISTYTNLCYKHERLWFTVFYPCCSVSLPEGANVFLFPQYCLFPFQEFYGMK